MSAGATARPHQPASATVTAGSAAAQVPSHATLEARRWSPVRTTLALCTLFVLALVPRTANLDQHATADEDLTLIRSANVALALERGDWWGTYQIGHPEATVQLLVAIGLGADRLRPYAGEFLGADARTSARVPGYFGTLVQARSLLSPVHALLIALAALLVWRLWGVAAGLMTGLLLAFEPFIVAHGRILRTDALLSELMLVAVLAALAFWSRRAGVWALLVCILATGLALLTKTPALALFGAVPAAAVAGLLAGVRPHPLTHSPAVGEPGAVKQAIGLLLPLGVWLAGSLMVVAAVWPAMWARPLRAVERMAIYTQEKGGSPMDAGGFFLGVPVPDPGPLYYAVALPLRLSPVLLAGLLFWLMFRAPQARRGVGLILLTGVGLAVVLALLPKKADRYILPAIPFLAVVASVGLAAAADRWRRLGTAGVASVVAAGEIALLALAWPYPLAAYNPLLGGAPAAERWVSVGWGEGLDQLAPVLNGRLDRDFLTVSTPYPEVLQAQIVGRAVDLDAYDVADYVVRYVAASQRHLSTPALDAALAGREAISRIEIAGIEYAELYELDRPTLVGNLQIRQLAVEPSLTVRRGWITVRLALGPASAEGRRTGSDFGAGLTPFVTPLDVEAALVNASDPNDAEATVTRSLLPDGSPAELRLRAPNGLGRYVVALRVRDAATGAPYNVTAWPVGAPRLPDRLVFPSLTVRVQ